VENSNLVSIANILFGFSKDYYFLIDEGRELVWSNESYRGDFAAMIPQPHLVLMSMEAIPEFIPYHLRGEERFVRWTIHSFPGCRERAFHGIDVTELVHREQVAQRELDLRKAIQSHAQMGILEMDASGNLQFADTTLCEMMNAQPDELLGLGYLNFLHPDDANDFFLEWVECLAENSEFQADVRSRFSNDTERWLSFRISPRVGAILSEKALSIGSVLDITSLKRVQLELDVLKERFQLGLKSQKAGVWDWILDSDELIWDEKLREIYSISPATVPNFNLWSSLVHLEDKDRFINSIQTFRNNGGNFSTRFRLIQNGNQTRHVHCTGIALRSEDGRVSRLTGITWDVTHEAMLEQAVEKERLHSISISKMASLGEVSSGVAHEINNPLAIILGKASYLRRARAMEKLSDEQMEKGLMTIEETARRIERVVGIMRSFSRESAASLSSVVTVKRILDSVGVTYSARMRELQIDFRIKDYDDSLAILGSESKLLQVFFSLISNSQEAVAGLKERWIEIEAVTQKETVAFSVRDSGQAIPESIREKMMQPFFSTKGPGKSMGLGLPIAYSIVREHGGQLGVVTEDPNTCIRFTVQRVNRFKIVA
jgi:PAS domain S-box-containing protein